MIRFHKEGKNILLFTYIIFAVIVVTMGLVLPVKSFLFIFLSVVLIFIVLFISFFFRKPERKLEPVDNTIVSPADGKIVAIEKIFVDEFIKEEKIQVSIFMSPLNVHINWAPVGGTIKYFKYHCGKYLVAWHPKSSCSNERTTTIIETPDKVEIVVRQIAGAMARRIVSYAQEAKNITQGEELGFIKFGSRVDVFLPLNSEILVSINEKVKGNITHIAKLKN